MTSEVQGSPKRPEVDPKLQEDFDHVMHFLEHNLETLEFFTSIIHVMENRQAGFESSRPILPESRVGALVPKPSRVAVRETSSSAVHPQDIPHTGKNRT